MILPLEKQVAANISSYSVTAKAGETVYQIFEEPITEQDVKEFEAEANRLWCERHGHNYEQNLSNMLTSEISYSPKPHIFICRICKRKRVKVTKEEYIEEP